MILLFFQEAGLLSDVGVYSAMRSIRGTGKTYMIVLISVGICLQVLVARSQESGDGHQPAGDDAAHEPRSQDSSSPATDKERYMKAVSDFRAGKLSQAARELQPLKSA